MLARAGPSGGVGQLRFGEQALRKPRRALECAFEPIDLEQIDPDLYRGPALTRP
jgi:hypothetical protein